MDLISKKPYSVLFLNRFGEAMGERGVQKLLRKYLKKAKIERGSIHSLRYTFGAQHIEKGTSLKTIQEAIGLKDSRFASIYVSLERNLMSKQLQDTVL
jgi:site-specific recombinase XerD